MLPISGIKPGDRFALADAVNVFAINALDGLAFELHPGEVVTAACPPNAVGGLWVHEARLSGSIYLPWRLLSPTVEAAAPEETCKCNLFFGPCHCAK